MAGTFKTKHSTCTAFSVILVIVIIGLQPGFAESDKITFQMDKEKIVPGEIVEISGNVTKSPEQPVAVEIKDPEGNTILIRTVQTDAEGNFNLKFRVPETSSASGEYEVAANTQVDEKPVTTTQSVSASNVSSKEKQQEESKESEKDKEENGGGGGCLIATATYGSEMAPQVQMLREIRDSHLLKTKSGSAFMEQFNSIYYSFSPAIADLERENDTFREVVKVTITPLMSSLSLLQHVDMDTEADVLGYGIGIISLNVGVYFVGPFFGIYCLRKRLRAG